MSSRANGMDVAAALGEVGLPAPIEELAARSWDAIVVGGGHNGLTAAAYLARAGKSVLVLERRERIGGACTLERPFADAPEYIVSPCAYVVGLLDDEVIERARARAPRLPGDPGRPQFVEPAARRHRDGRVPRPLPDGRAHALAGFQRARTSAAFEAYEDAFHRLRDALRRGPEGDTWHRPSPTRAEIEQLLGGDAELISMLFEESIADVLDRYIDDERLKTRCGVRA